MPRALFTARQVSTLVRQCLENGAPVEIDGLGVFRRNKRGTFQFTAYTQPKVFLAYVEEDIEPAERLAEELRRGGCDPWLDRQKLLPGQNWPRSIESAIELSDYFVALFSTRSALKRGQFQAELRYALDCASRLPLDQTFVIPARLEECGVPARITNAIQYVDLFPHWERGVKRVLRAVRLKRLTAGRTSS